MSLARLRETRLQSTCVAKGFKRFFNSSMYRILKEDDVRYMARRAVAGAAVMGLTMSPYRIRLGRATDLTNDPAERRKPRSTPSLGAAATGRALSRR